MIITIEALYISNQIASPTRNLSYDLKYKISLSISALLFLLMAILLLLTVIKAIHNIRSLKQNPSRVLVVTQGLNKTRLVYSCLYFLHFFLIRTFIALMVVLSQFVPSRTLWIVVLVVQGAMLLFHGAKFYETWELYLQGLV